ncbi:hypothetical protein [Thiohalorhabdus sp.]|uniref:hypothetical protein n=1 Tax=Thiohalorhabdus sp. TaxID=3094134 RepID=UPI002FC3A0A6
MAETFEGKGYLFQDGRLVAPVRYRLRSERDAWGHSAANGELWVASQRWTGNPGDSYVMHTEDGFSLPLELTRKPIGQWQPFRRLSHREVADGLG